MELINENLGFAGAKQSVLKTVDGMGILICVQHLLLTCLDPQGNHYPRMELNTSNVRKMFYSYLFNPDIGGWDTSIEDMFGMFLRLQSRW